MATIEDSNLAVIIEMLDFIIKKISSFEELFNKSDKSNKTQITLQEASKRVSLSKPTLLKLINNGDITAKKLDGKWLINVDSLENYLLGDKKIIDNFIKSML